jgi:hypothetical protein
VYSSPQLGAFVIFVVDSTRRSSTDMCGVSVMTHGLAVLCFRRGAGIVPKDKIFCSALFFNFPATVAFLVME